MCVHVHWSQSEVLQAFPELLPTADAHGESCGTWKINIFVIKLVKYGNHFNQHHTSKLKTCNKYMYCLRL